MLCPACQAEVNAESVFCQKCGARLDDQEALLGPQADGEATSQASDDASATADAPAASGRSTSAGDRLRTSSDQRQTDDDTEHELWQGGFSAKAMVSYWCGSALITAAILVFGVWRVRSMGWWGILLLAVVLAWIVPFCVLGFRKFNVGYRLTSQRFFHEQGILRRVTDRIEVIDMDDITFTQGILERMLAVGTIQVVSSDRTHPELWIRGIDDVQRVAALIDDARRKERLRRGLHIEAI